MKTRLGRQEFLLLAYTQMRGMRTVRTGELMEPLRLSREQERELFRRMSRGGLLARVRPGLYLVPPRLPLGLRWGPSQAETINALMDDCGGRYQICGANAFNHYGFDDQVPNRLYAYNNRISGDRKIGIIDMTLIKVADNRLGGAETIATLEGPALVYSSRVRSLVDAVYDWSRFDGIPRGYRWIAAELAAQRVTSTDLANMTVKYGDIGTIRRIGALLERLGVTGKALQILEGTLPATRSPIPWLPRRPKRGQTLTRWGIVQNEPTPSIAAPATP